MPMLTSVNVGMPRDHAWSGRTVYTGAWKEPVAGARMVRRLGMEGDGQGDTVGHGGPNRAVLVYQLESYAHWREHLGRPDVSPGMLAENLTVDGLSDHEVCIGDRYRIGEAEFEVSQPRVTCFRAGLRLGRPDIAALLVAHRRPGFYMRVVTEGRVAAGDTVVRTMTGPGKVSVAAVDALLYLPDPDPETLRRAVAIPALSPGWRTSLQELLDAAEHPRAAAPTEPAWPGFRAMRVADVVAESPTVTSFYLAAPDAGALPAASPGQYLTIRLPEPGPNAVRSYSLSGNATGDSYRISVKCESHGEVSRYLHDHVRPGDTLEVAAPRGEFVLDEGSMSAPILLISAGVGITPVLAMLHQLADDSSARPIWWLHAARTPEQLAFGPETRALLDRLPAAHAVTYFSAARDGARRLDAQAVQELHLPTDAIAYICGPDGFMSDIQAALLTCGLDPANIRTEAFGSRSAINPGLVGEPEHHPHLPAGPPGTGPTITFARSGITAPFDESVRTILEFAEACDIPARWQCRTGVCRTCETGLLAGTVAYQPTPLDTPRPGTMLPCCSRPENDVVLDM
ncbi:MAG TPA: MOSC and FAD-binding oxidoreductase domain-containing protein [Actinospica sp.]|nr:MOSC and FAD-binding oxidoreductase domain-containing protein [Actinospica sp.]